MDKNTKIDLNKLMSSLFSHKEKGGETGDRVKNSLFKKTAAVNKASLKRLFSPASLMASFSRRKSEVFITGLDIGISAVKSALFSCKSGSAMQLEALDIEEIPYESFESPSRPGLIKEKIKKMQARHSLKGKVFVSVPMPDLLVESMYLPVMPAEELDKAVRWEAREKLLVEDEANVMDYLDLGEVKTGQQVQKEIIFFSVPKKNILDSYQVLSGLGLRIIAIRPSFLAAVQGFEGKSVWGGDEVVGVLDIGAGSSKLSIISGGCLHFNRSFNVSGDSITRSVADYCHISYEEAERNKRDIGMSKMALEEDRKEGGVSEQPIVRISHAIGLHLDQLITEVQHTADYFLLQVSAVPLSKMSRLVLTGGGASIKGVTEFFKSRMNISVDVPNPLNYVQLKSKQPHQEQYLDSGLRFAAAIGLMQQK